MSGRPLLPLATRMLAETYVRVESAFPLIGVGGIDSGMLRSAKSAPAQRSFSSIPRWCSPASASSPKSSQRSSPRSTAIRRTILVTTSGLMPHPSRQSRGRNNGRDWADAYQPPSMPKLVIT